VATLLEVLKVFGIIIGSLVAWTVVLLIWALLEQAFQSWRRRRRLPARTGRADPATPHSWRMALLLEADDERGLLAPRVQLYGRPTPPSAVLTLEVVDGDGQVQHRQQRNLRGATWGTEQALIPFAPPDGATLADVVGWHWDVTVVDPNGLRGHWRERLRRAPALNVEAELADAPAGS
jgi:hypothetical protein